MNPLNHLKLIRDNPGVYKFIPDDKLAEILLQLLEQKSLFKSIKIKDGENGKDGYTPQAGIDYMSRQEQESLIKELVSAIQLPEVINGKDGNDGVDGADAEITDEDIQFVIDTVYDAIFPLLPTPLTSEEVRDRLELLTGDERLDKDAVKGISELENAIEELRNRPEGGGGGGLGNRQVQKLIDKAIQSIPTSTNTWIYYATTWSSTPTLNASITGGDVYTYTLDGTPRYRFVPTTYNPTLDAFYSNFDGINLSGLIVSRG